MEVGRKILKVFTTNQLTDSCWAIPFLNLYRGIDELFQGIETGFSKGFLIIVQIFQGGY